jgi:hypothetical protein
MSLGRAWTLSTNRSMWAASWRFSAPARSQRERPPRGTPAITRTGDQGPPGPSKASKPISGTGRALPLGCGQEEPPSTCPRLGEDGSGLAFPRQHRAHPRT